jgi:hypothetical protein
MAAGLLSVPAVFQATSLRQALITNRPASKADKANLFKLILTFPSH